MDTPPLTTLPQNEHDLLVTIHSQVGRALTDIKDVKDDIKSLRDNVSDRVSQLESSKVNKLDLDAAKIVADKIHQDHEDRLRAVEKQADETTTSLSSSNKTWAIVITIVGIALTVLSIYLNFHPH